MKKNTILGAFLLVIMLIGSMQIKAQVAINTDGSAPAASAMLDITSTNKGILIPRVADATAISSPATGLLVYQTGAPVGFYYYNGTLWAQLNNVWASSGSNISYSSGSVAIGTSGPNGSAILDLTNSSNKGLLIPTIADVLSILSPAQSLLVYQTGGTAGFYYYEGSSWTRLASGAGSVASVSADSPLSSTGGTDPTISLGTVNTTKGGTGLTSYTQGQLLYYSTGTTLTRLSKNTSATRYLSNTGTSNNPAWAQIDLSNGVTGILPFTNGGTQWLNEGSDIYFSGGNVGINVTPSSRLHVKNDDAGQQYIAYFENATSDNGNSYGIQIQAGYDGSNNNNRLVNFIRPDGGVLGAIVQASGSSVNYSSSSDERLKDNIKDTELNINTLMQIKVRDYTWKNDASKKNNIGFIAQELFNVFPDAVSQPNKPNGTWMVSKESLVPLLVKSIQDQQSIIKSQEEKIKSLEERLSAIEKLINK